MKVSIILPTYNRAAFLPEAFESIRNQSFRDWELIVVDDGSTDDTRSIVESFARSIPQNVRYVFQKNGGAYSARNRGLDEATGQYVAFNDSDDLWVSHHLSDGIAVLEAYSDVGWVFGAIRRIDKGSGTVVESNNQLQDGRPKRFRSLKSKSRGKATLITDSRCIEFAIDDVFTGGLQSAVIRTEVFDSFRFDERFRNGQDRFAVLDAILKGVGIAYFPDIHVNYRIHSENDSLIGNSSSEAKKVRIQTELIKQYENLLDRNNLDSRVRRTLRRKLFKEYTWCLGYSTYWEHGNTQEGLKAIRKGLQHWPWSFLGWKTYLACLAKISFARLHSRNQQSKRRTEVRQ